MSRPSVDVVIPFAGAASELRALLGRLEPVAAALPGDRVTVADNRSRQAPVLPAPVTLTLIAARSKRSSYHARNVAARAGTAPWLLFLDADVEWGPELLDAYFDPPPGERTAVVGGGIADAPLRSGRRATVAELYSVQNATMAAARTLAHPERIPYAQTANCLVRRAAFEAAGGFADGIRSGGDADLCFRLQRAGWAIEQRPRALALHRNRSTLRALLRQKARHGAGAAWLERRHPGTFPRRRMAGLAWWSVRTAARAVAQRDGGGPGSRSTPLVDVLAVWAFELGRLLPNGRRR